MPKEQYEALGEALIQMSTPYRTVEDFVNTHAREVLQKYGEWKKANTRRTRRE
jgi:hypothetical protein